MRIAVMILSAVLIMAGSGMPAPAAPKHETQGPELSTPLSATDSLNVAGDNSATTPDGDAHRTHLESTIFRRENPVEYEANGRRDPFRALLVDEKKTGEVETELLQLDDAVLTGVVWAEGQYLALVRDKDGKNFFLREGDPVYQGHVSLVTQSQATFEISDFGDYQNVVLKVRVQGKGRGDKKDKG